MPQVLEDKVIGQLRQLQKQLGLVSNSVSQLRGTSRTGEKGVPCCWLPSQCHTASSEAVGCCACSTGGTWLERVTTSVARLSVAVRLVSLDLGR